MIVLHGKLTAKKGKGNQLKDALLRASELVSKAKGCKLYAISMKGQEPESVFVTEIWESKEDHQNSLKEDTVKALIASVLPILEGMPQGSGALEIVGGFGI